MTMEAAVILPTAYGSIALTRDELRKACELARETDPFPAGNSGDYVVSKPANERLLDAKEAAAELGVKPSWLLQRAREGRIHHVRLGKYIRFDVTRIRAEGERQPW